MEDIKQKLIRMGSEDPSLRDHIRPILAEITREAQKDHHDQAYDLIMNGDSLIQSLDKIVKNLDRTLQRSKTQVKNLDRVGSGKISAPDILGGDPLHELKVLGNHVDRLIKQIEDIKKGRGRGRLPL